MNLLTEITEIYGELCEANLKISVYICNCIKHDYYELSIDLNHIYYIIDSGY